ncbi:MAG: glutamine amidotransferase [Proteobacteria bacterium]|nr:glutamine amidotransferase [Pseudomonadota bacterium]
MKRAVALRHLAFEDLGLLAGELAAAHYDATYRDAGVDGLADLQLDSDDLLIVLGGPISAYDDDRYPFLADELRLIEQSLRRKVPVLGICLGAQLLARVLGARVYPGSAREIGFAAVALTAAGRRGCLADLEREATPVLHWHGDTFDLPAGAEHLAATEITPNQAFALGASVLGLQFHVEADLACFERWLVGHTGELSAERIDINRLRAAARQYAVSLTRSGRSVLKHWLNGLGA